MLYERKLREVPTGWGMQDSRKSIDVFFYQESDNEDNDEENTSKMFCFVYKEAAQEGDEDEIRLHAFALPSFLKAIQSQGRVNDQKIFQMDMYDEDEDEEAKAALNQRAQ